MEFLNYFYNNDDFEKLLKCLTELQALRKENTMRRIELTNAQLEKQIIVYEVDKLRQTSKDLKDQIKTAYSVINKFNKQQAIRSSIYSQQIIQVKAITTENTFLTEQISTLQENFSKLKMENLELLSKCHRLEINSVYFNEKYTRASEFLQSLDKVIRKLEENQKCLKSLIEKSIIDINGVNQSILSNKLDENHIKHENLALKEKITELLLRLPLDPPNCSSLNKECDKLSSALMREQSRNIELSNSLAICLSTQNKILKNFGKSCDKSVQTEI